MNDCWMKEKTAGPRRMSGIGGDVLLNELKVMRMLLLAPPFLVKVLSSWRFADGQG